MQEKNACDQDFLKRAPRTYPCRSGEPAACPLTLHARLLACLGRRVSSIPKGALE
jgi:hypothetical protein